MNDTKKRITGRDGILDRRLKGFVRHISRSAGSTLKSARSHLLSLKLSDGTAELLTEALRSVFLALSAFLLGRCDLGFHVYPFGLALLIACEKGTLAALVGSALASLTYPELSLSFFGVNALIYIIRKVLLSETLSETPRVRVILGAFTGVFVSCALLLSDGSQGGAALRLYGRFDIILACAAYCTLLPLAVYLLHPLLSEHRFTKRRTSISLVSLGFLLVLSLSHTLPLGGVPSHFLACLLTLVCCVTFDGAGAVCAAALFGTATGNLPFAAPLAVAAFAFYSLHKERQLSVYAVFGGTCIFGAVLLTDLGRFSPWILLSILSAVLIFMPFGLVICAKKAASALESPSREAVSEAYTRRMTMLSGAFGSVSKLCYGFAGRMRYPTAEEAQVLIAVEASRVCTRCRSSAVCKRKQSWCSAAIAEALTDGKLTVQSLPEALCRVCDSKGEILSRINEEYKRLLSDRFCNNKTEILAREYASVAKILKYTSRISCEDSHYDSALTEAAARAADRLGLPSKGAAVYGTRRKVLELSGVPVSSITDTSGSLASYFSSELGTLLDVPEFILEENGTFTLRFVSKERIAVEYVKATHTKGGEAVCGDTVTFFESSDSFFYALIADGMGSGRDAAMTSRLTSVFVEKLLSGGAGKGVTMELLNSLLLSKSRESFSSVDLLEVDLIERRASFVKAGAAPAYLLRAAKLFKVSSDTPPCGIIEAFSAENTSFEVFSGDVIIMLSDGVTSAIDCSTAICDIMNKHQASPLETTAQAILDLAASVAAHDDDMSCVIAKVK